MQIIYAVIQRIVYFAGEILVPEDIAKNFSADEIVKRLVEQVTGSVRWRETVKFMADNNVTNVVELGAGKVLSGIVKRSNKEINAISVGAPAEIEELAKVL